MAAINSRTESGLYTSASEVIREALRLFLQVKQAKLSRIFSNEDKSMDVGNRLASTLDLFDFGMTIKKHKLKKLYPNKSEREITEELQALSRSGEVDDVIQPSPKRLSRLRISNESK